MPNGYQPFSVLAAKAVFNAEQKAEEAAGIASAFDGLTPATLPVSTAQAASIASASSTGNLVWVDAVNGVDASGMRGRRDRPFLTLTAAKNAATSGDTVVVFPGTYNEGELSKNGVNWNFFIGATVLWTSGGNGGAIFSDTSGPMTFSVTGNGDFFHVATVASGPASLGSCFRFENSSSTVSIKIRDAKIDITYEGEDDAGNFNVLLARQATVYLEARSLIGLGFDGTPIWWDGAGAGRMHVTCDRIYRDSDGNPAIYLSATTATGDAYIRAQEITSEQSEAIASLSQDDSSAAWILAERIIGKAAIEDVCVSHSSGKLYITSQKITGSLIQSGGLFYLESQKWDRIKGSFSGGNSWVRIDQIDPILANSVSVSGGAHIWRGFYHKLITGTSSGFILSGGTLRIGSCVIDSSLSTGGNPITISASGLIIESATFICASGRNCITAASANTAKVYSAFSNVGVNVNVTQQVGTVTVSANVS